MSSRSAKGPPRGREGAADPPRLELQRARKLVTAAEAVRQFPFAGLSDGGVNGRAAISRETLEANLQGREACLLAAFESVLALAADRATAAFQAQEGWPDRVRAGLLALLEFFDEEPSLARFLVVHSVQAGPAVLARRGEVLDRLAGVLDDEHAPARRDAQPFAAQAAVSCVLGVVHGRLSTPNPGLLTGLADPLTSLIVLPFAGEHAAHRQHSRPVDEAPAPRGRSVALDLLKDPGGRRNRARKLLVLRVIAEEPGLTNREIALRVGIKEDAQISRILIGFARMGLIENTAPNPGPGTRNAWQLTPSARELQRALGHAGPAPRADVPPDLPADLADRLGDRAIAVLLIVGDQPWLSTTEVGQRLPVQDRAQASLVLRRLVKLGLAASRRDHQRRGGPYIWQLTLSGVEVYRAVRGDIPAPKRSVALDLMMRSGGPLGDRAIAILRVIGAEPGLSNRQVGDRVGVKGQVHISQLLARLLSRGLNENTCDAPGVENEWQLTATGEELERAIWAETPAAQRSVALALMLGSGGPLSDRAISLLRLIGAEPGLNDRGVTRRVGLKDRTYVAKVLADLTARGLIQNTRRGGRANAWQLTATGEKLERAIWAESSETMQLSVARDLLRDPDGHLDEHVLSVLELISSEPGLSDIEIARRTDLESQEHASRLLAHLARLSLIESTDVHGHENAWQQTAGGRALLHGGPGTALPRKAPSPSRGVALDLIGEFGGRMTQRAVSALKVIERQPGLGSRDVARRIGVTAESHVHELFALLRKHDLAKNVRAGGHENQWRLTPGGQELQGVLWGKASPAHQRSVALDLMRDFGGGMSENLAAAFRLIATEPGLGNSQIRERVGISEGHISNVLARLTRTGLIENARTGRDSDWQPTASGSELMRAILEQEARDAGRWKCGGHDLRRLTASAVCSKRSLKSEYRLDGGVLVRQRRAPGLAPTRRPSRLADVPHECGCVFQRLTDRG